MSHNGEMGELPDFEQPPVVEGVPVPSQNNQLRVISDTVEKVKVTNIHPLVGYPVSGKFGFRVLGEGFSLVPTDNQLIRTEGGAIDVHAGQAIVTAPGEWVRYSTPGADGAEYVAVCLPAFSPATVHRDE